MDNSYALTDLTACGRQEDGQHVRNGEAQVSDLPLE
jgi:hypothetical protein